MNQIQQEAEPDGRHDQQAIRRWGNSLALRLPADCLRQAGLQEGDELSIVDRAGLAADLLQLHRSMPTTASVMEECRSGERW